MCLEFLECLLDEEIPNLCEYPEEVYDILKSSDFKLIDPLFELAMRVDYECVSLAHGEEKAAQFYGTFLNYKYGAWIMFSQGRTINRLKAENARLRELRNVPACGVVEE